MTSRFTGGCQCGAVRFACESLGRASLCHCRMCQKAFGSYFAPLATAHGLPGRAGPQAFPELQRGAPRLLRPNAARR